MSLRGKAQWVRPLAVWISRLFHPFISSTLALLSAQLFSGVQLQLALAWTGLTIAVLILPVLTFVLFKVKTGRYDDIDVSVREDRYVLYTLAGVCFILLIALLSFLNAPGIVQNTLRAALFAFTIAAVLNRFVGKVSLHMLALGGCAAVFFFVSVPIGVFVALLGLPVAWSRLYLKRHTMLETVLGWSIGFVGFSIWLLIVRI